MRRPRSKLEVSTFPFLAVLLCAMGSLLLLLFIMDRRAKVAAQNNTRETLAKRKKRSQDEEDARLAAWEKAREQLHQALLLKQEELIVESGGVNDKLNNISKGIVILQSKHVELEQQVKDEKNKIATIQLQLADRRDSLKKAEQRETMSKAELLDATKELAELEAALILMKSLKEHEKSIYSVVPYRGKRGDMRPPIYIECVRSGVIFHPENRLLSYWEIRPEAMRAEVEERAGPLRARQAVLEKGQTPPKGPYVLFLIRPDGISNYYQAQAALRGYHVDFGYEMVDANWVLDFTLDPYAKRPPAHVAKGPAMGIAASPGSGFGPDDGSSRGIGQGGAYAGPGGVIGGPYQGNGSPGRGIGPGGPYPGLGTNAAGPYPGNGSGRSPTIGPIAGYGGPVPIVGVPTVGTVGVPLLPPPPSFNPGGPGVGTTSLPPPPLGVNPGTLGHGTPGVGETPPSGFDPGGNVASAPGVGAPGGHGSPGPVGANGTASSQPSTGNPPYAIPDGKGPSFVPIARTNGPAVPGFLGNPNTAGSGGAGTGTMTPEMIASAGPGSLKGNPPSATGAVGNQQGASPTNTLDPGNHGATPQTGPSGTATNGQAGGGNGPAGGTATNGQADGANGSAGGATANGQAGSANGSPSGGHGSPSGANGSPGDGNGSPGDGDSSPGFPAQRPLPSYGAIQPRKTATPAPLSKMVGNKDFLITIDCFGDHLNVFPGGTLHRWSATNTQDADQLLVQTVTNLIARRQASVRAGEPPYRPLIRFQVSPEGLRTYYHAYPLLEHLRVPMSRENVVE